MQLLDDLSRRVYKPVKLIKLLFEGEIFGNRRALLPELKTVVNVAQVYKDYPRVVNRR